MLNDGQGELLVGYTGQVGRVTMGPYLCYKCSQRNVVVSCLYLFILFINPFNPNGPVYPYHTVTKQWRT